MSTLTLNQIKLNWNARLTDRDTDVCKQVIYGGTRDEVASMFYITTYAVIEIIRRAFRKTGARNIAELATWIWCKEFNMTMIISEGKRKIITLAMIALVLTAEFAPDSSKFIRTARVKAMRTMRAKTRRTEYPTIEL